MCQLWTTVAVAVAFAAAACVLCSADGAVGAVEGCAAACTCRRRGPRARLTVAKCAPAPDAPLPALALSNTQLVVSFANNPIRYVHGSWQLNGTSVLISFRNCSVERLGIGLFEKAANISSLDLGENALTDEELHAAVFQGPYSERSYRPISLSTLDLSHNRITRLERRLFEHTPGLRRLDLSGNPLGTLSGDTWAAVSSLRQLQQLRLAGCSLTHLAPPPPQTPTLKQLHLPHNNLSTIPPLALLISHNLDTLHLDGNPVPTLSNSSFKGLRHLRALRLSHMKYLTHIYSDSFSNLTSLRSLHLHDNPRLSFIDKHAFGSRGSWPPLHELYISNNNLKNLSVNLLDWERLESVRLDGNPWRCEGGKLGRRLRACLLTEAGDRREAARGWRRSEVALLLLAAAVCAAGAAVLARRSRCRAAASTFAPFTVVYTAIPVPHAPH